MHIEIKSTSRYQEATLDMRPTANFHYLPLWDTDSQPTIPAALP